MHDRIQIVGRLRQGRIEKSRMTLKLITEVDTTKEHNGCSPNRGMRGDEFG